MQPTPHQIEAILAKAGSRSLESTLFNVAHAYARAGQQSVQAIFAEKDADFAAPAIMCKSFAIELLLKFFIVLAYPAARTYADLEALKVDLRGHFYTELFDRVNVEYQKKIAETFSVAVNRKVDQLDFRAILVDIGNNPFVQWRYIYESQGIRHFNPTLFDAVLNALGKAAEFERRRLATNAPSSTAPPSTCQS